MRRLAALLLALILNTFAAEEGKAEEPAPKLTLLVPAYSYLAGEGLVLWERMIAVADRVPIVAIANIDSGPERIKNPSPSYADVIPRAQAAGIRLIGYVSTDYARRDLAEVRRDIAKWVNLYPTIECIFFDEQSTDRRRVEHYERLSRYTRTWRRCSSG